MPSKCRQCPEPAVARGLCAKHLAQERYHPLRPRRAPWKGKRKAGPFDYSDEQWRRVSRAFLAKHPICAACERSGRFTPAEVVDHILPVRLYPERAWDEANYQALCTKRPFSCHQRKTGWERNGFALDFRRGKRVPLLNRMTGGQPCSA